jgi:hypothetical protein
MKARNLLFCLEGHPGERPAKWLACRLGIRLTHLGIEAPWLWAARLGGWLQGFAARPLGGWKS